jgi:hypothetical protein
MVIPRDDVSMGRKQPSPPLITKPLGNHTTPRQKTSIDQSAPRLAG